MLTPFNARVSLILVHVTSVIITVRKTPEWVTLAIKSSNIISKSQKARPAETSTLILSDPVTPSQSAAYLAPLRTPPIDTPKRIFVPKSLIHMGVAHWSHPRNVVLTTVARHSTPMSLMTSSREPPSLKERKTRDKACRSPCRAKSSK